MRGQHPVKACPHVFCSPDVCVPLTEKLLDEKFKPFSLKLGLGEKKNIFNPENNTSGPAGYLA